MALMLHECIAFTACMIYKPGFIVTNCPRTNVQTILSWDVGITSLVSEKKGGAFHTCSSKHLHLLPFCTCEVTLGLYSISIIVI